MREAFPSLPFGSPALDRDSRGKDRTVERDAQQLNATNLSSSSISTSPATHTHRDDFPRNIERESSFSVINTDANTKQTSASATAVTPVPLSHPGELEELQSILHFPEEVALRLTDAEYQLFYQVPPVDYFKHVILELQNESGTLLVQTKSTIRALQKRFDEVCSWVTHFIISQPTHDERKAAFSCLLRAALTCWNIGNFNGAMEITTGLRSLSTQYTEFHSSLGGLVVGDSGMTLSHDTALRVALPSCDHENIQRVEHPQCSGIPIPSNDPIHQIYPNQSCMHFVRTIPCARCRLGPRMISSSVPAALDLNSVYGVSTAMSDARRTMVGGRLKSQIIKGHEIFAVERTNATGRFRCFEGKCEVSPFDVRNMQLPTAQMFALLFHRNHNNHARKLAKCRPSWSDEQIFQEARRWNIAEYQHCIFSEYLKTLIGRVLSYKFEILPKSTGQFSAYKPNAKLKSVVEFQSTAGRYGHAGLNEDINLIDPITGEKSKISFRDAAKGESIFYEGQVDGAILGQISTPSFETTTFIPFKTFLLDMPERTFGLDLGAIDIQRQRDHGIPGYIYYLKYCQNVVVQRWDDLRRFIQAENIEKLKKYYKNVEDIDLFTGGLYERKIADALVGPTFACIIGITFHNVKYGDRFFYEHGSQVGSFSTKQLNEIKTKTSFASILCKTTKLGKVSRDPLRLLSRTNQFVDCSKFVDIDYQVGVANGN